MLEGKAKQLFEEWYEKDWINKRLPPIRAFYEYSLSIQWGVYLEWADSMGYELCVDWGVDSELNFIDSFSYVVINTKTCDNYGGGGNKDTRKEAQTEAIKKLSELINNE